MLYKATPPTTTDILAYVTMEEIKKQLGISHTAFDTRLESLVVAAYQWAEDFTGRYFLPQTITAYAASWGDVEITRTPLRTLTSIHYRADAESAFAELATTNYRLVEGGVLDANIYFINQPSVAYCQDAIKIMYAAGYESAAVIPHQVKNAILMYASDQWKSRGNRPDLKVSLAEKMLHSIKVVRV